MKFHDWIVDWIVDWIIGWMVDWLIFFCTMISYEICSFIDVSFLCFVLIMIMFVLVLKCVWYECGVIGLYLACLVVAGNV